MREKNKVIAEPKPLGVIDVLTAGFELVRRRPWTMLVPILMDLGIWLLPRLSPANLMRPIIDQMFATGDVSPDVAQAMQEQREMLNQAIGSLNLFGMASTVGSWISHLPTLFSPSFVSGMSIDVHSPINALAYTIQLPSPEFALLLFIPMLMLVLLAGAVFAELVAQGVRPLVTEPRYAWMIRAAMLWVRLLGFAFLLGMVLFGTSILVGLVQLFAPATMDIGSFLGALLVVGWFWLSIYFFFAVSAMAVSNVGLMTAIRRSIVVFRVHFWPSLLLIALTVFFTEGLALLWRGLTVTPVGIILGIAANAFIGASLLAASMIFYQDRMNAIERMLAHARAASRPTR